jgi:heterodisulfide reductase subunit D
MTRDIKNPDPDAQAGENKEARELPLGNLDMRHIIALDACTRCGECLTWCPVYDQDAKEAIIPRRKVIDFLTIIKAQHGVRARILKSPKLSPGLRSRLGRLLGHHPVQETQIEDFVKNLYECSTCGQCEVVCPAHIETVGLWEELRRIMVEAGYGPLEAQKGLAKSVKSFDNPWQQPRAGRTKWARRAIKDGMIRTMPREIRKSKGKVLLFFGCTAAYDVNVKQVAINSINILEALDIDYGILGSEEKCCASVLLRMGDPEHKRVFKENIDIFNSLGIETLISSCSGCFKTILQDYPKVAPLNFEVLHTVEFLARLLKQGKLHFPHRVERTVTYHDPCHLGRATGGFDAPRMIMEAIPGLKLSEMPRNREYSRCCGAGGGLKAGYPDIQNKMAQRRIREAEETGAAQLVSCCPFCYQGLNIGITAMGSPLVMKDISSLVAEALLGYDVFSQPVEPEPEKESLREAHAAPQATSPSLQAVPAAETPSAAPESRPASEPPADDKAEKERLRAAKRAARRGNAMATPSAPADAGQVPATTRAAAPAVSVAASSPAAGAPPSQEDEKALRRAQKRAARRQATEGVAVAIATPASTEASEALPKPSEALPEPPEEPPVATTQPACDAGSSESVETVAIGKSDREARRAAQRAEREKEKAARRAARSGA